MIGDIPVPSNNNDLRGTYIGAPSSDNPAGINIEDFMMESNQPQQNNSDTEIDKKRLGEIINEVG